MSSTPPKTSKRTFIHSMNFKVAILVTAFSLMVALPVAIYAELELKRLSLRATTEMEYELSQAMAAELPQALKLGFTGVVDERLDYVVERAGDSFAYARVFKADGTLMGERGDPAMVDTELLTQKEAEVTEALAAWASGDAFQLVFPVIDPKKNVLRGTVTMVWDPAATFARLNERKLIEAALGLSLLLVSCVISFLVLRRVLATPLKQLGGNLNEIAKGRYDTTIPAAKRKDELGAIAEHVQNLQSSLQQGKDAEAARLAEQQQQSQAVEELRQALKALANQDLAYSMDAHLSATYEPLRQDFNSALAGIADMMAQVLGTSSDILSRTTEIRQGSGDLSSRIHTQSDTLGEIANGMGQLTRSVQDAAEGAREVNQIVGQAVNEAQSNAAVVEHAVSAMEEIENSASQIATIISTIDDIAFQTNLLALNAGVEAARAGEAGAGFAVVASEVRALALRTSHAATEIKTLITDATAHIENGVSEVNNTGEVLQHIITRMDDISSRVSTSAKGFVRDSTELQGLAGQINDLGAMTQQNDEIVAMNTQSVDVLRDDATRLDALASAFTLPSGSALHGLTQNAA